MGWSVDDPISAQQYGRRDGDIDRVGSLQVDGEASINMDRRQREFGSWEIVAAKWALGLIPSEALPWIAADALEAGLDTPSLRLLAGELRPTLGDSGPLFEDVLDELRIAIPDKSRAGLVLAKAYAAQITDGSVSPYDGACQIWRLWRLQLDVDGLTPFVYWASEWQQADSSAGRGQCETAIRAAARDLVGAA